MVFGTGAVFAASATARTPKLVFRITVTPMHVSNDTAIDDQEWKNPIDFGENRKTKMVTGGHFDEDMKKLVHSIT